jgi:hypothetical protein
MTSEIAVLNRLGVALAADSAVTITRGSSSKVFISADKLFDLSEKFPVGVMINDNMDCFGVPWEIIIKDFRLARGGVAHATIVEWAEDFFAFVGKRDDIRNGFGAKFVELLLINEANSLLNKAFDKLLNKKKTRNYDIVELICEAASEQNAELKEFEKIDSDLDSIISDFLDSKRGELIKVIKNEFKDISLSEETMKIIISNIKLILNSKNRTGFSTGVIFAGYGQNDAYPSVYPTVVNGYVGDRLIYFEAEKRAAVGGLDFGHVVSFAQTDVSERLLEGVDPSFIDNTVAFLSDASEELAPHIVNALFPNQKRAKQKRIDQVRKFLAVIPGHYQNFAAKNFRKEFRKEFERMIGMMPKMELIEFAEALISITAVERKATTDQGTVGGPIDVAFISRHEGFVWIKRKHYFDPRLNPAYFWRKYPPQTGRQHHDNREPPEAT